MRRIKTAQNQQAPVQPQVPGDQGEGVDPTEALVEAIKRNPQALNYFREVVKDAKAQALNNLSTALQSDNTLLEVGEQSGVQGEPDYDQLAQQLAQLFGF